jgi:hypothetical protein
VVCEKLNILCNQVVRKVDIHTEARGKEMKPGPVLEER